MAGCTARTVRNASFVVLIAACTLLDRVHLRADVFCEEIVQSRCAPAGSQSRYGFLCDVNPRIPNPNTCNDFYNDVCEGYCADHVPPGTRAPFRDLNISYCSGTRESMAGTCWCKGSQPCPAVNDGGDPCAFGCTPGYEPTPPDGCHSDAAIDQCGCCPTFSPIIVNMDGKAIEMSDAAHGALFDINGLRHMFMVAWPTTTANAWLARDVNGNGSIDSGAELFGNATRLQRGGIARQGFEALEEFDVNRDGLVDATDPMFASLLLWFDLNRDGVSNPEELIPFSSRFTAISTDARESGKTDRYGNAFRFKAKVFVDGRRDGPTAWFAYDVFPVVKFVSR